VSHPLRVALVGHGKIARDQHLPAIYASAEFECVAVVDPVRQTVPQPWFADIDALLASGMAFDAAVLCQPPQARYAAAVPLLHSGRHVLLEKPPGASVGEVDLLRDLARARACTLYCAWHSRHAPGVAPAANWLHGRTLRSATIHWKEDVRVWHPGQHWIWEAGGLGVFDPGINALSIATQLLGSPLRVVEGMLSFPANRDAPVAAELELATAAGAPLNVQLEWLHPGPPVWDIEIVTTSGTLRLREGGGRLEIDGRETDVGPVREYASIYAAFAARVRDGGSEVDVAPLQVVADAFLRCRYRHVERFEG
jgi:predicted dehydrogenase